MLFILDFDDTCAHTTRDLQNDVNRYEELKSVKGIHSFLNKYGDQTELVSIATHGLQMKKIKQVGIADLLRGISVVKSAVEKAKLFRKLAATGAESPGTTVVIGDRLDRDIFNGNKIGCITVRMRLSDGKYSGVEPLEGSMETPDYTVSNFNELLELPIFIEN